tara:strand:- start:214 stop:468 length:255 start_codon:yes stop_codon:yes gene_type:complete
VKKNQDQSLLNYSKSFSYFQKILKQSAVAASGSYGLIASILLCTLLGWHIDNQNEEISPFGILGGLFLGILIGFYHLFKIIRIK